MIKTTQNNYSDYVNSNYTTTISTSTLGDTLTFNDQTVTVSLPDDMDDILSNGFTYTTTPEPSSITLGKVVLTEDKLERLSALLDIIEGMEPGDLLDMINTQTALNRIKNDTTESD